VYRRSEAATGSAGFRAGCTPEPEVEMSSDVDEVASENPTHPEEMKSVFDLRVGKHITLQGSARITPAGVISTGIAVAAVALAFGYLASSVKRRRY
jgi:hypothetical protein